jgi:glutamyl-Q tRNA(Asp) synthetase
LYWDGEVYHQSHHLSRYQSLLDDLTNSGQIYACRCSRKQLAQQLIYPGSCREACFPDDELTAFRIKINAQPITFEDECQGELTQNLSEESGDFIVRRRDQIIAYQFAVVVDDHDQGVNHVIRGVDLLDSTPKQIYLHQQLGFKLPHYLHLPVIVDAEGQKLSKQTLAAPVNTQNPSHTIWRLLNMLGQNPPINLQETSITEQIQWAIAHWQPQALKKIRAIRPGFD